MRILAGKDEGVALRIVSALQLLVGIGFWVLYFCLGFSRPGGAPAALTIISGPFFHNNISDPVLHVLVLILTGGIALCFIPIILVVGLYLLAFFIALGFLAALIGLLLSLGRVSVTGAIVAGLISLAALYGVFRLIRGSLWPKLRPYVQPAIDAIYGAFFDWWLTPLVMHGKKVSIRTARRGRLLKRVGAAMAAAGAIILIIAAGMPALSSSTSITGRIDDRAPSGSSALPTPALIAPNDKVVLAHFPRTTTLRWGAVAGAVSYIVQVDALDPQTCAKCRLAPGWISERDNQIYILKSGITATTFTFDFAGMQPGRWRVTAVDQYGREGSKSSWREFRYTK